MERKKHNMNYSYEHLTKAEIETCKEFFDAVDKDGDGAID